MPTAPQAMDPIQQEKEYGFSYPPLPVPGLDPNIDRALEMVRNGESPGNIRELDAWTGMQHFTYALPDVVSQATQTPNIWLLVDGQYKWIDSSGEISDNAPSWAPPKPQVEDGQYDPQRAVTVQYPSGDTVTLTKPNYAPLQPGGANVTPLPFTPQTDGKAGVTTTSVPSGTQTAPATTGNVTGSMTQDEQVQAAAMAGVNRTDLNWDEWGFYYRQIYGEAAPAPEDSGFNRAADGSVSINGATRYPFSVWKQAAFGGGGTGGGGTGGGGTGGGGTGGGGTGGGGNGGGGNGGDGNGGDGKGGGGAGAVTVSHYVLALMAAIIGGDSGWSRYVV